jgi:diketogulonate reductase-like aldo/keto reductase
MMVTFSAADGALTLPARSVVMAVIVWVPAATTEVATDQTPKSLARHVPSNSRTVALAWAVPVNTGFVTCKLRPRQHSRNCRIRITARGAGMESLQLSSL